MRVPPREESQLVRAVYLAPQARDSGLIAAVNAAGKVSDGSVYRASTCEAWGWLKVHLLEPSLRDGDRRRVAILTAIIVTLSGRFRAGQCHGAVS